jgi:hypothetical protein
MSYVLQYSRHKPVGPDISSPHDKTFDTVATEASRRFRHMLPSNLCVMQTGQLRNFMTVQRCLLSYVHGQSSLVSPSGQH